MVYVFPNLRAAERRVRRVMDAKWFRTHEVTKPQDRRNISRNSLVVFEIVAITFLSLAF